MRIRQLYPVKKVFAIIVDSNEALRNQVISLFEGFCDGVVAVENENEINSAKEKLSLEKGYTENDFLMILDIDRQNYSGRLILPEAAPIPIGEEFYSRLQTYMEDV